MLIHVAVIVILDSVAHILWNAGLLHTRLQGVAKIVQAPRLQHRLGVYFAQFGQHCPVQPGFATRQIRNRYCAINRKQPPGVGSDCRQAFENSQRHIAERHMVLVSVLGAMRRQFPNPTSMVKFRAYRFADFIAALPDQNQQLHHLAVWVSKRLGRAPKGDQFDVRKRPLYGFLRGRFVHMIGRR